MFTLRKLVEPENECYFRWFSWWHRGGQPTIMRCEEIAAVEKDGIFYAGIMTQRIPQSACCLFTAVCRNPFVDKDLSSEAVNFLIKNLGPLAKKLGYKYYVSLVGEEAAKVRYRKCGVKELQNSLTLFYGEC